MIIFKRAPINPLWLPRFTGCQAQAPGRDKPPDDFMTRSLPPRGTAPRARRDNSFTLGTAAPCHVNGAGVFAWRFNTVASQKRAGAPSSRGHKGGLTGAAGCVRSPGGDPAAPSSSSSLHPLLSIIITVTLLLYGCWLILLCLVV